MKKVIMAIFALALVTGVFAQTPALTFGMYGDITAEVSSTNSYGIYSETYLSYKAKDMGFNATVIAQTGKTWDEVKRVNSPFDVFGSPRNYKFWYTLCNGLKVSAGNLREAGPARLTSYIDGNGFSTRMANVQEGLMIDSTAVKNVAISWFTPSTASSPVTDLKASSLGIAYTIPSTAKIVAEYRSSLPLLPNEASLGVDLLIIKDTTLKAGFKNTGGVFSFSGFMGPNNYLYATWGKAQGDMNYGVDANVQMTGSVPGFSPIYGIKGMVEYTMGDYVLGAKVSADNGDPWYGNGGLFVNPYVKRNFAAGDIVVGITYDASTTNISLPVDFELSF